MKNATHTKNMIISQLTDGEWQPVADMPVLLEDWMDGTWERHVGDEYCRHWQGEKVGVYGWNWAED